VEAEAIGVEAEAVDEIAASTSLAGAGAGVNIEVCAGANQNC